MVEQQHVVLVVEVDLPAVERAVERSVDVRSRSGGLFGGQEDDVYATVCRVRFLHRRTHFDLSNLRPSVG